MSGVFRGPGLEDPNVETHPTKHCILIAQLKCIRRYSIYVPSCSIYICMQFTQFTYCTSNWPGHMFFIHLTRSLFTANLLSRDTSAPPRACCYDDPSWKSGLGATVPPPVHCKFKEQPFFTYQGCLVHCQILNSLKYLTFCWPGTWFLLGWPGFRK